MKGSRHLLLISLAISALFVSENSCSRPMQTLGEDQDMTQTSDLQLDREVERMGLVFKDASGANINQNALLSRKGISLARKLQPVELTGGDLPELIGWDVNTIVAFTFDKDWQQIPVQIDQRHIQRWEVIKPEDCRVLGKNLSDLVYSDPFTYSGDDLDPTFDLDDELIIMAKDLGISGVPIFVEPPKYVDQDSMVEVVIKDPLIKSVLYYVYFFRSLFNDKAPMLSQDAGQRRVNYTFNLTRTHPDTGSNDYLDVYKLECDELASSSRCNDTTMNPEDTWFRSSVYEQHFAENWYTDAIRIRPKNGQNGQNFWGTQDFQFAPDYCGRSVKTFLHGSTAFIANKVGPLRAIRSWVGANSAAITQSDLKMYESMEDQVTYIKVHMVPGLFHYINFYEGMTEMVYFNKWNINGFSVDGTMDAEEEMFNNKFSPWDVVTGPFGSFFRSTEIKHDLHKIYGPQFEKTDNVFQAWYYDNAVPEGPGDNGAPKHPNGWSMCSANLNNQTAAWGTIGYILNSKLRFIPNTDPIRKILVSAVEDVMACESPLDSRPLSKLNIKSRHYFSSENVFDPQDGESQHRSSIEPMYRREV